MWEIPNAAAIARAVGMLWSSSASNRMRESALRLVERAILELMGQIDECEVPSRAGERRGIDHRSLRRTALDLLPAFRGDALIQLMAVPHGFQRCVRK